MNCCRCCCPNSGVEDSSHLNPMAAEGSPLLPPTPQAFESRDQPFPSNRGDICLVGYALNSKKMRKSSRTPEDYQSNACDKKKESIWRGGGLADVLESSHRGVVFEAFEYDSKKNLNQVVCLLHIK